MKRLFDIFVVSLAYFVLSAESLPITFKSFEHRDNLVEAYRKCAEKSSLDDSIVESVRKDVIVDDIKLKNFALCFYQETNVRDANGILNKERFEEILKMVTGDEALATQLSTKCLVQKETPLEETFFTFKCLFENSPKHAQGYKDLIETVKYRKQQSTYHNECLTKSLVDRKIVKEAKKRGEFVEDPKFKSYLLCLSQKMGFIGENGDFESTEIVRRNIKTNVEEENLVDIIMKNCLVKKITKEDTAYTFYKCYYDSTPIHIDVLPDSKGDDKFRKGDHFHTECLAQSAVAEELVEKERKGEFVEDPKLKDYMYCMTKKIGIQNETGFVRKQTIREKLAHTIKDETVTEKLIDLCGLDKSSPLETAYFLVKCVQENSPLNVNILKPTRRDNDEKRKIKSFIRDCSVKTGVSKKSVLLARKGDFQEDPLLKEYIFCISQKGGIQNEQGNVNKDFIKKKLTGRFGTEAGNQIFEKCVFEKDTPQNTAFEAYKCFFKDTATQIYTFY